MRKSYVYFGAVVLLYGLSMIFANQVVMEERIMSVLPLSMALNFMFTVLFLFGLLWCIGARWQEDKKLIKKK